MADDDRAIPVSFKFCYLGSMLSVDGTDTLDVDARIAKASAAFGALAECLFRSTSVTFAAKAAAYRALILSVLLYGSES